MAEGWEAPSALALQPEPLSSHDKSCVCLEGAQLGLYPLEFALGRVYGPGATLITLKLGSFFLSTKKPRSLIALPHPSIQQLLLDPGPAASFL